jgi:predicted small lipoprotein YifL
MLKWLLLTSLLSAGLLLVSCGQKGPLYLPDNKPAQDKPYK